jgi:hypothetical protein
LVNTDKQDKSSGRPHYLVSRFFFYGWLLRQKTMLLTPMSHFDTNLSEKTDKYFSQSELLTDYPV